MTVITQATLREMAVEIAGSNIWRTYEGEGKPYGVDVNKLSALIASALANAADSPEARIGTKLMELDARLSTHTDWGPQSQGEKQNFMALALSGEAGELAEEAVMALAVCGKVGRLANLFKKEWRGDYTTATALGDARMKKRMEMCDIGAYLFIMACIDGMGVTGLIDLMMQKTLEVEQRPEYKARMARNQS